MVRTRLFSTTGVAIAAIVAVIMIAGANGVASAQEAATRDLRREMAEPRLRINAAGHVGAVHALAFTRNSDRLCSGGLDKNVLVWNMTALSRDLQRVYLRERTIRWPVARGLRGSIFAMAASPSEDLVAVGGYGAMSASGDVFLVDPILGTLEHVLYGGRQTVCSLSFSADGKHLAVMHTNGEARLWSRGADATQWQSRILYPRDQEHFGKTDAAAGQRKARRIAKEFSRWPYRPIVVAGSDGVVLPYCTQQVAEDTAAGSLDRLTWRLVKIGIGDPSAFGRLTQVHRGMVTAMAVSPDGKRLASADLGMAPRRGVLATIDDGPSIYVWDLTDEPRLAKRLKPGAAVISLGFSPDGQTLVAGTKAPAGQKKAQLQVRRSDSNWEVVGGPRLVDDPVHACAISHDGSRLAYVGGTNGEVFVEPLDAPQRRVTLSGKGRRVLKVAFAQQKPYYRVAFSTKLHGDPTRITFNDYGPLEKTFNAERSALETLPPGEETSWLNAEWGRGRWSARRQPDGSLQLFSGDTKKGTVRLAGQLPGFDEGKPRSYCWLPGASGEPVAIAVGTGRQNSIYICRLVDRGDCPIVRHFRGHHDFVTSLGVSRDLKYLVSASADGTVRFWSLAGYRDGGLPAASDRPNGAPRPRANLSRWGARFEVQGAGPAAKLVAVEVDKAGPLYRKGLREGHALAEIRWPDPANGQERREADPTAIGRRLARMPWGTSVLFEHARGGAQQKPFLLLPAWQPLATLFVNTDRDWAFWSPFGYYDSSAAGGHRLFGWQVNRGRDELPGYFRADQFSKTLERPDVMRGLLRHGSLQAAFDQAQAQPEVELHRSVADQIAKTPDVRIVLPDHPDKMAVDENRTRVTARVKMPDGSDAFKPRVFANGVPGRLVSKKPIEGSDEWLCEWDVALPSDEKIWLQVVVGSPLRPSAIPQLLVSRPEAAPGEAKPKLYVLALGIDQYAEGTEIPNLAGCVADAKGVSNLLRTQTGGLYELKDATLLTDRQVTPDNWRESVQRLLAELKDRAQPDDLLIVFMAGHGVRDANQYYYVGHEAKATDVIVGKQFEDCIPWTDFRPLADIPCRKLALLDTCYSGAIQPASADDLKAAGRSLQEDFIFTVTAAEGDEKAVPTRNQQHGVFTWCMLEGLRGKADQSRDGVVTLNELIVYVRRFVPSVAQQSVKDHQQHPTAAPADLLGVASIPLTRVAAVDGEASQTRPAAGAVASTRKSSRHPRNTDPRPE